MSDDFTGDAKQVVVYTPELLPISQPWIADHARGLRRHKGYLIGRKQVSGSKIGDLDTWCLEEKQGKFLSSLFLLSGRNRSLENIIRRISPGVIHAHFGPGGTEILPIARKLRIPLLVTFHGWDVKSLSKKQKRTIYERLYASRFEELKCYAKAFLVPSMSLRKELLDVGAPEEITRVHYLGINFADFAALAPSPLPNIIVLGRLVPRKGAHIALAALELLKAIVPSVSMTFVGTGPELANLEQFSRARNLPAVFLGAQSQEEVRRLLCQARVHCFPSIVDGGHQAEPFGIAAIEAQAAGLPVVGSRIGGIVEAVKDGETGLLVPQNDPRELAQALQRLLTDPDLHSRMSRAAKTFVETTFDSRKKSAELEDLYEKITENCSKA